MTKLSHRFVEELPPELDSGVIYISIKYSIISHKCCCGCGNEVMTNISPRAWSLIYDGQTVTLCPSIGNWNLPCRSHYWIRKSTVQWAESWEEYQRRAKNSVILPEPLKKLRKRKSIRGYFRKRSGS